MKMTVLELMFRKITRERGIRSEAVEDGFKAQLGGLFVRYGASSDVEGLYVQSQEGLEMLFLRTTFLGQDYKTFHVAVQEGCVLDYLRLVQHYANNHLPTVQALRGWLELSLPSGKALERKLDNFFEDSEYPAMLSLCDAFFPLK